MVKCRKNYEKGLLVLRRRCFIHISFLLISFFTMLFLPTQGSFQAEELPSPKISIDDLSHNFGTVSEGTIVKHSFKVKNEGNADLIIQRLVPSCGCTASNADSDLIKAGTEGAVNVEFDTTGFSGDKLKSVKLYSNDSERPSVLLTLKGIVEPEIIIEPRAVIFENVLKGSKRVQEVIVRAASGSKAKILNVTSSSQKLDLQIKEKSNSRILLAVSLNNDNLKLGEIRERLVVNYSNNGSQEYLNIPVFAVVEGQIKVSPPVLSFGIIEGKEIIKRSLKIESRGTSSFNLKSIVSNHPAVTATIKPVQPGKIFVVEVALDPKKVTKQIRALMTIETSSVEDPKLYVNIYGAEPPKV